MPVFMQIILSLIICESKKMLHLFFTTFHSHIAEQHCKYFDGNGLAVVLPDHKGTHQDEHKEAVPGRRLRGQGVTQGDRRPI